MRILRYLFWLIIFLFLLCIALPYFLVQTQWSAPFIARYFSQLNEDYEITFARLQHSFDDPWQIEFEQLQLSPKKPNVPIFISAEKADFTLDSLFNFEFQAPSLKKIAFTDCQIDLTQSAFTPKQTIDLIEFDRCDLRSMFHDQTVQLQDLSGSITNWQGFSAFQQLQSPFKWQLSAQNILLDQTLEIKNVFTEGHFENQQLCVTQFGAQFEFGAAIGQLTLQPQSKTTLFNRLQLYKWHYQTPQTVQMAIAQSPFLNALWQSDWQVHIDEFSLSEADLMFADFNLEKANLTLKNIAFNDQHFNFDQLNLTFSAQHFALNEELFLNPVLKIESNLALHSFQFLSDWREGQIQLSGAFENASKTLDIEQAQALNVIYRLPHSFWALKIEDFLPRYIDRISIKQTNGLQSALLYPEADFPFEFSGFEWSGSDIEIARDKEQITQSGTIEIMSDSATINKIALRNLNAQLDLTRDKNRLIFDAQTGSQTESGLIEIAITQQGNEMQLEAKGEQTSSAWLQNGFKLQNVPESEDQHLVLQGSLNPYELNGIGVFDEQTEVIENNQVK